MSMSTPSSHSLVSPLTGEPLAPPPSNGRELLAELDRRGLYHQCTDLDGLAAHLDGAARTVYCGFDPTADSLTIGNLVPIMLLAHFRRAGHNVVVVQGGATGRIGDPSGKEAERAMRTEEEIQANLRAQRPIFERILSAPVVAPADDGAGAPIAIVDNYEWFRSIGFIQALREIGKHFSVNEMIKRDSVRNRLEGRDQGISYTEFSYVLLQAYDFLHLFRAHGVTVQAAGADQWGNIVSGTDLIRRWTAGHGADAGEGHASPAFGFTAPLLTKADGTKFGKTECGAVWLSARQGGDDSSPNRTSAYAMFQFWLNADDADVVRYLRIFTFLSHERIAALERLTREEPHRREAQRVLAREVTAMVHGAEAMRRAEDAGKALFSGDVGGFDLQTIDEVFVGVPSAEVLRDQLAGDGMPMADALVLAGLARSKREAREFLTAGAVQVNGQPAAADATLTEAGLMHGQVALLRRGKKQWAVLRAQ
jgi:tyrosyl-tRNA synthetase